MDLKVTRTILDSIHDGSLCKIPTKKSNVFGLHVPDYCPGVDSRILSPENTWNSKVIYIIC